MTIQNTIVAGNSAFFGSDIIGTVTSLGHNLIEDASSAFIGGPGGGDIFSQPADLGPVHDNGGPTPTMALLPSSPALDAGDPALAGGTDQRGVVRPANDVDIGAYQHAPVSPIPVPAPPASPVSVPPVVVAFGPLVVAVDSDPLAEREIAVVLAAPSGGFDIPLPDRRPLFVPSGNTPTLNSSIVGDVALPSEKSLLSISGSSDEDRDADTHFYPPADAVSDERAAAILEGQNWDGAPSTAHVHEIAIAQKCASAADLVFQIAVATDE
jgi:hypothetical protein